MKQKESETERAKHQASAERGGPENGEEGEAGEAVGMRNTFTVDDERICQDASSDARIKFNIECTAHSISGSNGGNSDDTNANKRLHIVPGGRGGADGEREERTKIEK